jgi:hypothetical protein
MEQHLTSQFSGLQVEFPLYSMDVSRDTVSNILDIAETCTVEQVLSKITSEMGINPEIQKIAYKTSQMKAKEDPIIIDCLTTFATGLQEQCGIQYHTKTEQHLKIFNLVSPISNFLFF